MLTGSVGSGGGDMTSPSLPKIMLRRALSGSGDNECVVCMEEQADTILVHGENGHMCVCNACSKRLTTCPICRKPVEKPVFVFKHS